MSDEKMESNATNAQIDKDESKQSVDIYITREQDKWGAVMSRMRYKITFSADEGVELPEFVQNIKNDLSNIGIKPKFHYVKDEQIESQFVEHHDELDKLRAMQTFNGRYDYKI